MQLRAQLSDLKTIRKDLEDLRAENSSLQTKYNKQQFFYFFNLNFFFRYESINSQRNRDKQRITDLEKSINEEKQSKQRLETQIKTEKTLTKKLQDDLAKLNLTPPKFVLFILFYFNRNFILNFQK